MPIFRTTLEKQIDSNYQEAGFEKSKVKLQCLTGEEKLGFGSKNQEFRRKKTEGSRNRDSTVNA